VSAVVERSEAIERLAQQLRAAGAGFVVARADRP
jgi:hypothetical protein